MPAAIALFVIGVAVLLSVVVGLVALQAMKRTAHHVVQCSRTASELASKLAQLKKLENEVAELGDLCLTIQTSVNKWRGRAAALTHQNASVSNAQLTGAAWKDEMRKKLRVATPATKPGGTTSED